MLTPVFPNFRVGMVPGKAETPSELMASSSFFAFFALHELIKALLAANDPAARELF
jgi:hypothetical protein